jgi:hypothetical protein
MLDAVVAFQQRPVQSEDRCGAGEIDGVAASRMRLNEEPKPGKRLDEGRKIIRRPVWIAGMQFAGDVIFLSGRFRVQR